MEACRYNSINVDVLADGTSALADDSPAGVIIIIMCFNGILLGVG